MIQGTTSYLTHNKSYLPYTSLDLYAGAKQRQNEMNRLEQSMKNDQFYFTRKGTNVSQVDTHPRGHIEIVDRKVQNSNNRYHIFMLILC